MIIKEIDGKLLQKMIVSAANHLENNKKIVDDLNVFPVPDGDTGTNMSLTLLAASREVEQKNDDSVSAIANELASASLRGARGNSGVILSQLFRGFAKKLKNHDRMDAKIFAQAFKAGVDTAYKAVMKPTEGTILTVAREGAAKAVALSRSTRDIVEVLARSIDHAKYVLNRTPEMLPILKQAGVVDAGGKGLIFILEGALQAIRSGEGVRLEVQHGEDQKQDKRRQPVEHDITFTYCTEFIIDIKQSRPRNPIEINQFRNVIAGQGDSMLVIDDDDIVKVHIHTNNPGIVIQEALKIGELTDIKIENMKEQHEHIYVKDQGEETDIKEETAPETEEEAEYGFIAVAAGKGIVNIFKDLGVDEVIEGGQTMNPSTDDVLKCINSINAKNIFIFPNNKNIILAAQQAKKMSDRNIAVIPTKSIPQGISAMLAFDANTAADDNYHHMTQAIDGVKTGDVTYAVRNCTVGDKEIAKGDVLGIRNGEIFTTGESVNTVCHQLLEGLLDEDSLMITIFYGHDIDEQTAQDLSNYIQDHYPDCEIEVHHGGQPLYYYIISVE